MGAAVSSGSISISSVRSCAEFGAKSFYVLYWTGLSVSVPIMTLSLSDYRCSWLAIPIRIFDAIGVTSWLKSAGLMWLPLAKSKLMEFMTALPVL